MVETNTDKNTIAWKIFSGRYWWKQVWHGLKFGWYLKKQTIWLYKLWICHWALNYKGFVCLPCCLKTSARLYDTVNICTYLSRVLSLWQSFTVSSSALPDWCEQSFTGSEICLYWNVVSAWYMMVFLFLVWDLLQRAKSQIYNHKKVLKFIVPHKSSSAKGFLPNICRSWSKPEFFGCLSVLAWRCDGSGCATRCWLPRSQL